MDEDASSRLVVMWWSGPVVWCLVSGSHRKTVRHRVRLTSTPTVALAIHDWLIACLPVMGHHQAEAEPSEAAADLHRAGRAGRAGGRAAAAGRLPLVGAQPDAGDGQAAGPGHCK